MKGRIEVAKEMGINAENYFCSRLNKLGIPYEFVDDWYDFKVCGHKVEVKSCGISVREGDKLRSGRFDFTDEENRENQYKANVWVCFIARASGQFIILGLCRAKQLDKKRYITLSQYRDLRLIDFEEWISRVNND